MKTARRVRPVLCRWRRARWRPSRRAALEERAGRYARALIGGGTAGSRWTLTGDCGVASAVRGLSCREGSMAQATGCTATQRAQQPSESGAISLSDPSVAGCAAAPDSAITTLGVSPRSSSSRSSMTSKDWQPRHHTAIKPARRRGTWRERSRRTHGIIGRRAPERQSWPPIGAYGALCRVKRPAGSVMPVPVVNVRIV